MNNYTRNGIMAGAFVGCVGAFSNWDGRPIVAASSIVFATLIGWLVGWVIRNRRK